MENRRSRGLLGHCSSEGHARGRDGEFTMAQYTALLNGVVIIRGVPTTSDSFTQGRGRTCLEDPSTQAGGLL